MKIDLWEPLRPVNHPSRVLDPAESHSLPVTRAFAAFGWAGRVHGTDADPSPTDLWVPCSVGLLLAAQSLLTGCVTVIGIWVLGLTSWAIPIGLLWSAGATAVQRLAMADIFDNGARHPVMAVAQAFIPSVIAGSPAWLAQAFAGRAAAHGTSVESAVHGLSVTLFLLIISIGLAAVAPVVRRAPSPTSARRIGSRGPRSGEPRGSQDPKPPNGIPRMMLWIGGMRDDLAAAIPETGGHFRPRSYMLLSCAALGAGAGWSAAHRIGMAEVVGVVTGMIWGTICLVVLRHGSMEVGEPRPPWERYGTLALSGWCCAVLGTITAQMVTVGFLEQIGQIAPRGAPITLLPHPLVWLFTVGLYLLPVLRWSGPSRPDELYHYRLRLIDQSVREEGQRSA